MQRVRMLRDQLARLDGEMRWLKAGQEYAVDDFMFRQLVDLGVIEMAADELEHAAIEASPETAVEQPAPRRRGRPPRARD
jgi:hypothetical protein